MLSLLEGSNDIDCGVCSLPSEYCEFTPTIAKCKEWLQSHHDDLFEKLFAGVELTEKQQKTTEKHEAKQKRAEEKKMQSKVLIKRIERGKRKYVTGVFGLEIFGIEYVPPFANDQELTSSDSSQRQRSSPTSLRQARVCQRTIRTWTR